MRLRLAACLAVIASLFAVPGASAQITLAGWGNNDHGQLGMGFRGGFYKLPTNATILPGEPSQVSAEYFDTYALVGGTLYTYGGNDGGFLGNGTNIEADTPQAILQGVSQVAGGGGHGIALASGRVDTWGGNNYGQLGDGVPGENQEGRNGLSPVTLAIPNAVQVVAGGANDAAVLGDGTVLDWGENRWGQVGDGTVSMERDVPTPVTGLTNVKTVALGGAGTLGGHALALLNDGTVVAWGQNGQGQLGLGYTSREVATPTPVPGLSNVVAISADVSHSMALTADGTVYAWGSNTYGQLGIPVAASTATPTAVLSGVSAISAGFRYSLALVDGQVLAWGWNHYDTLGDGTQEDKSVPTPVKGLSNVRSIAAGEYHSLALVEGAPLEPAFKVTPITGFRLTWDDPVEPTSPWFVGWRLKTYPRATEWEGKVSLPRPARSYEITGLTPGATYEVHVRAVPFGNPIATITAP